ncbi:hypothetical protein F414_gp23 [Cronobacter phage ESP2949-1]|uniref:dATP/dGTP diphosphohydrolase MazZ domain-containing protein n=1 Tax=Cronobacter phage ESP2949-1 TaxID=2920894 RepID=G1CSS0_9CAUD|nr:hypothetical protein F414_gp23 [Cronobacter phage ESP2949-1]AEM24776.1 hypothetical protein [Cronobacter phage ESP2949-1]
MKSLKLDLKKLSPEAIDRIIEAVRNAPAGNVIFESEKVEADGAPDLDKVIYHFRDLNEGFPVERFKADYVIAWMLANYPPAPVSVRERAEPVAWRHDDGPFASGALTRSKSVAEGWIGNGWKVTPLYTAPPAQAVPEIITTLERQRDDLLAALESLVLFTNPKPSNAAALNNAHQVIARTKGRAMPNQADKASPPKSELAQRASQILAYATELANRISAQVGNEYQQFASMGETEVQARYRVRIEHANWSQETFGAVGPIGPLKHLAKEAIEAAENPGDLFEWADMQFLLWDAQRRAGITDEQITKAMIEKLAVNKSRKWPEPEDGEPRHHIKDSAE